jgi:hypothetical protein
MSRNISIALVIGFFVVGGIFGSVFWHVDNGAGEDLKKSLEKNKLNSPAAVEGASTVSKSTAAPADATVASAAKVLSEKVAEPVTPAEPEAKSAASNETKTPPTTPTTPPATDETTNWKVYKDEKNKFEFKYPSEATVSSNGDGITISRGDIAWKIRVYKDDKNLDLQSWYIDYFSEKERKNCVLSSSTLKVANYETEYVNPNSGLLVCERDGYFSIDGNRKTVLKINLDKESVENVNKILATFKFSA